VTAYQFSTVLSSGRFLESTSQFHKTGMFKTVQNKIWFFDCEWIPDAVTGRVVYDLKEEMDEESVMKEMWERGGATEDDPTPYLKTILCRVVSIAAITRTINQGTTALRLLSLPREPHGRDSSSEAEILDLFLNAIGRHKPQLVGYNSHASDLKILIQRATVNCVQAEAFSQRPEKPWEGIDYFARGSEYNIDLTDIIGSWGKSSPSLHQMATACGFPGKISVDGNQVAGLWLEGALDKIVAYNEFDAITTYLLWLRLAFFGGFLSPEAFNQEQEMLKEMMAGEIKSGNKGHLQIYLDEWQELERKTKRNLSGSEIT
jgi:3'-5' exonuclease